MSQPVFLSVLALAGFSAICPAAGADQARPMVLAQAQMNAPATKAGTIVKAAKPADIAGFLKKLGATKVAIDGDVVTGVYKDANISVTSTTSGDSLGEIIYYANFGEQSSVDQAFINAFNKNRYARIYKRDDNAIILWLGANFNSGVTIEYVEDFTAVFMNSIDKALTYKVE